MNISTREEFQSTVLSLLQESHSRLTPYWFADVEVFALQRFRKMAKRLMAGVVLSTSVFILLPSLTIQLMGVKPTDAPGNHAGTSAASGDAMPKEIMTGPNLHLGWVMGDTVNPTKFTDYKGLSIVSPSLATIDDHFQLQVNQNQAEIDGLHKQQKNVWARVTINTDTKSNVHQMLSDKTQSGNLVNAIGKEAKDRHWDGVNLDIEQVQVQDRDAFSQFIKDLSSVLHHSNVSFSVDIPPDPQGGNRIAPFDHQVLGQYCDYVAFMGYDQHWSSDPNPGPVTSMPWLTDNVCELINTGIPSEKIILGLPSYTRIWQQNQQGQIVQNPAYSFSYVKELLAQNHKDMNWDGQLEEYYTTYEDNNTQYKIWLADTRSIQSYLTLVSKYNLAGSAIWSLNMIDPQSWNQIF